MQHHNTISHNSLFIDVVVDIVIVVVVVVVFLEELWTVKAVVAVVV